MDEGKFIFRCTMFMVSGCSYPLVDEVTTVPVRTTGNP